MTTHDADGHEHEHLTLEQLMFMASSEVYAELLVEMVEGRLRAGVHDADTEHAMLLTYIYDQLEAGVATDVSLANMLAAMTVKFAQERVDRSA